jgi:myo-inositol-1(or 4)-monophosphatase
MYLQVSDNSHIMANMNQSEKYLQVAITAAKQSGEIFNKYFGKAENVRRKDGNKFNLVSSADIKIERLINKIITGKFPSHQILGEESGWGKQKENSYKWIVDPIDGTTNFIQGVPLCATSIALWDKSGPLVAVVHDPLRKKLYQAVRGQGAEINGKKIQVSKIKKLGDTFGGFGWNEAYDPSVLNATRLSSKIITSARKARVLGSTVLQLAYVAEGIFDFYIVNAIKAWDFAASSLLITEAGGKVTDWQGKNPALDTNCLIGSNGATHSQLIKTIS